MIYKVLKNILVTSAILVVISSSLIAQQGKKQKKNINVRTVEKNEAPGKIEISFIPMAAFYNGNKGAAGNLSAVVPVSEHVTLGCGVIYQRVKTDAISLKIPGGYVTEGYTFKLGESFRLVPSLSLGGAYASISRGRISSFAAGYLSPKIKFDYLIPGSQVFRIGTACSYDIFLGSKERLSCFSAGLAFSHTL